LYDIYDSKNWDNLDNKARDILVEKGHMREEGLKFPLDDASRHFSYARSHRKISNGEVHDIKWLVIPSMVTKCIASVVRFKSNTSKSQSFLAHAGYKNWRHISFKLIEH
jgi:hypothetical protein